MSVRMVLAGRNEGPVGMSFQPEAPAPFLRRARAWFEAQVSDRLESIRLAFDAAGRPVLHLRLHPAADEVSLLATGDAKVVFAATTSAVGPGYHRYVCELLRGLGDALQVTWLERELTAGLGDPTGYFHTGDAAPLEEQMLNGLAAAAREALTVAERGGRSSALSLRAGHRFDHPGLLLTPLGPRDRSWLEAVREDPRRGLDIFPWWTPGLGAAERLGRALAKLWSEMVWRPPLLDEERKRFQQIARELELAWREDKTLAYPWREWQELLGYLGVGGTLAEEVTKRAAAAQTLPRIGYRRGTLQASLPAGWTLRIPGSLAESLLPDGSWVARDHRLTVRFVPVEAGRSPASEALTEPGFDELEHQGERVKSRATLRLQEKDSFVSAICESGGARALCVITFDDPEEKAEALGIWRSIDRVASA